jgi:hypothetical protein
MAMSPAGLGPENDCARGPAAIINDIHILSLERMLHKDYNRKGSVGKKIAGRGSQGAWRQDELMAVYRQSYSISDSENRQSNSGVPSEQLVES